MNTELICIVDRSGSMASIRAEAMAGFNKFIHEQRDAPGECRVTLVQFDDRYEMIYRAQPVSEVPIFVLIPRGYTALLDAIGRTLNSEAERIKAEGWADLVVVVVTTDGQENASKEYTVERVREMVAHAESHGWSFVWLAANIDAFSLAKNLGSIGTMANSATADAAGTFVNTVYQSTAVLSKRMGLSDEDAAETALFHAQRAAETEASKG